MRYIIIALLLAASSFTVACGPRECEPVVLPDVAPGYLFYEGGTWTADGNILGYSGYEDSVVWNHHHCL